MGLLLLQAVKGQAAEIVRVFLQTPTGGCRVDITRAVLQSHLQVTCHRSALSGLNSGCNRFSVIS